MPVPSSIPQTSEVITDDVMLAGFRDCTQEAIDFLINVENISESDPLIIGLKQHLENHRQELEITQAMEDVFQNVEEDMYNNNDNNNVETITDPTIDDTLVDEIADNEEAFDGDSTEQLFNSIEFLLLAQNNPRIASLADEIMEMMEETSA